VPKGGERFRVAVSGHRRLPADGRVPAGVDAALDAVAAAAGAAAAVVSSLAEGADRLVAERGLARPGWSLEVVLPLDAADYERDFEAGGSVAAFRSLLARADAVDRVPPQPTREDAYWAAGLEVLGRSDVLVAVWDGRPPRGRGGTGEVVARARAVGRPLAWVRVPDGDVVREGWPWAG
jgi:hypothetical protein